MKYFFQAMRPKQWLKNLLIFAAPIASGNIDEIDSVYRATLTFVSMCLVSSSIYLLNDVRDVEADRLHPEKKFRPIAAFKVSIRSALVTSFSLLFLGMIISWLLSPNLLLLTIIYVAIQLGYIYKFKQVPVLELFFVSSGFLIRSIMGAAALNLPPSIWLLSVIGGGSMLIVAGKRLSELNSNLKRLDGFVSRSVLGKYSSASLTAIATSAGTVSLISYLYWALENSSFRTPLINLSAISFAFSILFYLNLLITDGAEKPEDDLFNNTLVASGLITIALVVFGSLGSP